MSSRDKFDFLGNSLSKSMLFTALISGLFFRGRRNRTKVLQLLSKFFEVETSRIFLFSAARMAVYALIKSLNLREDDEVIVAGYTCVVLTNAVKFTGQPIRYVDIQETDCNLDPNALRSALTDKTKVLIAPHNFGIADEHLASIREEYPNLIIIEDVAHGFGSRDNGKRLCGKIGDASFFSLEYSKPITAGLGGILIINNQELLPEFQKDFDKIEYDGIGNALRKLLTLSAIVFSRSRWTSFFRINLMRFVRISGIGYATSVKEIEGEMPNSYPTKLHPLLCNLLVPQLTRIEDINRIKNQIVIEYRKFLSGFSSLLPIEVDDAVMIRYPLLFKDQVSNEQITALRNEALGKGFSFGDWFNDVVHPKGSYRYMYQEGSCPVGEKVADRMLNLPVNAFFRVSERDLKALVALMKKHGLN